MRDPNHTYKQGNDFCTGSYFSLAKERNILVSVDTGVQFRDYHYLYISIHKYIYIYIYLYYLCKYEFINFYIYQYKIENSHIL